MSRNLKMERYCTPKLDNQRAMFYLNFELLIAMNYMLGQHAGQASWAQRGVGDGWRMACELTMVGLLLAQHVEPIYAVYKKNNNKEFKIIYCCNLFKFKI